MKLSVVTTIFHTADCVEEFHRLTEEAARLLHCDFEVIFVNDGSPDNGWEVASALARRDPRVVSIDLARNVGQHRALLVGLEVATGDYVGIFDGDLEEDPRWVVQFYHSLRERDCDVVYGIQKLSHRSLMYRVGRRIFYRLVNLLSSIALPENVATARLMTRRYVNAVLGYEEREVFLAGLLYAVGFKQVGVPVTKVRQSPSSYGLLRLLRLFMNNVTSFSIRPLLGIFLGGVVLAAIAVLFILLLVMQWLLLGIGVPGWASIMAVALFSLAVTVLSNGVIAIYIATIFLEVKQRPRAIVSEIVRSQQDT
ncbi:MAG TPA: glycosyltransferase family 2 protein [Xanthobacteraceae bacterium]|jgi:putative glycosyltransferase